MENHKLNSEIDPDYKSYNSALEHSKEEDEKEKFNKLRKIIEDEFNTDIQQRQEQVEQIEEKILKARKLLHLLRYVLVSSYYSNKQLEYNASDEPSTSNGYVEFDKQNRIHPAIKKLLGSNLETLEEITSKPKRRPVLRKNFSSLGSKKQEPVASSSQVVDPLKLKSETKIKDTSVSVSIKKRKKSKHRLIIGNTSQYITDSDNQNLTHKWLVYVRGPKEASDISHIISKVVFYLHPSYRPYDVVEICESPFQIARRGWGEFPIRVKIFFKVALNKPIHIVHSIVLDKTYTGKQTLGKETLVDVFLYDDESYETLNEKNDTDNLQSAKKIKLDEDFLIKEEVVDFEYINEEEDDNNQSFDFNQKDEKAGPSERRKSEHDYCVDNIELLHLALDHSYGLMSDDLPKLEIEEIDQDENNYLIYGLDRIFAENYKKLLINKIAIPKYKLKNMGEALLYSFKKIQLCSELALDTSYKVLYPFTATSLKEFATWNVGKQRNSEWCRARMIKKLLQSANIHKSENWTTKAVLMYGRSHGFTPYITYGLFYNNISIKEQLNNCHQSSSNNIQLYKPKLVEENAKINVDTDLDNTASEVKRNVIKLSDNRFDLQCSFVHHTALKHGIILRNEEIEDGVLFNGAERTILEAVKCLAENLIRRARNNQICSKPASANSAVTKQHVENILWERPEMEALNRFHQQRNKLEYLP